MIRFRQKIFLKPITRVKAKMARLNRRVGLLNPAKYASKSGREGFNREIRSLKGDVNLANYVLELENEMDKTEERLKKSHLKRINEGVCSPEFTVMYTDIIHNIERIGDSCQNIVEAVLDDIHFVKHNKLQKEEKEVM